MLQWHEYVPGHLANEGLHCGCYAKTMNGEMHNKLAEIKHVKEKLVDLTATRSSLLHFYLSLN